MKPLAAFETDNETETDNELSINLLTAIPRIGLCEGDAINLTIKPRYLPGEVVIIRLMTGQTVLCAFIAAGLFLLFAEAGEPERLLKCHVSAYQILGSVIECARLRVLLPASAA